MAAGADSIDDMAVLRHGGMGRVFSHAYAPSTLGSFLRAFTFGHVRQLDAVASAFLLALAGLTPLLGDPKPHGRDELPGPYATLDIDDTIIEVHGHAKQGAGFGSCGVRGLNALIATLTTAASAPVIIGQRLRRAPAGHRAARNGWSPTPSRRPAAYSSRAPGYCCGPPARSMAPRSCTRP